MNEDPWLIWDISQMIEDWVQQTLEDQKDHPDAYDEIKTEEQLRSEAYEDHELIQMGWEDLTEILTEWMDDQETDEWRAEVENFDWQNLDGYKEFRATTGERLLQEILPNTECTYHIWKIEDEKALRLRNWHHDSPTGNEYYTIRPVKDD